MEKKQVASTPMGGSGYLCLHYWPPVDREPAINVDLNRLSKITQYNLQQLKT